METIESHVIFMNKFIFATLSWQETNKKVFVKYYYNGRELNPTNEKEKDVMDILSMEALKYCMANNLKLYSY